MSDIETQARRWLNSQILSHEGCIERLQGIRNDAVNVQAQTETIRRMTRELEMWRYLESLLPENKA